MHCPPASRCVIAVLIGLLLPCAPGWAQLSVRYSDKAEDIFKDGVSLYSATMYREAIATFDRIIRDYPLSQRVTGAYVMKGKAQFRIQEYLDAAKTMRDFVARYPASSYVPDADLTLGMVYQRIGRSQEAVENYLAGWRALPPVPPRGLLREMTSAFDTVLQSYPAADAVQRLLGEMARPDGRAYLWTKVAEKAAAAGELRLASVALDSVALRYGPFADAPRVADLRARITQGSSMKIGALMPLMKSSEPSAIKEIGNEVSEGIQYAFELFARDPSSRIRVGLETRDTERDPKITAKEAQELSDDRSVIGIIGPVFSMNAPAACAIASTRGVPIVTPTANANGIAAAGPYVFQANPDYEMRGEAMAQYAIVERGFRTVAVMAPSNTYGKFLAEGFLNKANKLGAKVVAVEWYQNGAADLKTQLGNIRRAAMILGSPPQLSFTGKLDPPTMMKYIDAGIPRKRLDSLLSRGAVVNAAALLGDNAQAKIDSFGLKVTYDLSKLDSLQYPVEGIQCLYVPISSSEEIGVVSSQVVYFNFHTQLVGSGEWNNIGELSANARYCGGVLFESDSYADTSNPSYSDFLTGFTARFRKSPSKNTLYGFDTATLMLDLIRDGGVSRESLAKALRGVREYQGLHAKTGFSSGRVSNWLTILQFGDDRIRRIGEIRVEE